MQKIKTLAFGLWKQKARTCIAIKSSPRFARLTLTMSQKSPSTSLNQDDNLIENNHDTDKQLTEDLDAISELERQYFKARADESNLWLTYLNSCHIYLYKGGGEQNEIVASFDLDGTLIRPKSNKRFPKSATDWQLWSVWTKVKLQHAVKTKKSRFVIFTNQNGVGLNIVPLSQVQERIELVTKALNIPCTVFIATENDNFRKPDIGMFTLFENAFNDSIRVDRENSFYCGDAIGYPSHSDADIKFAETLRLPFITPEKFVRGHAPKVQGETNAKQVA